MPPTSTLGSTPPWVSSQPASDVVVVLPCVPAITIERAPHRKCSRIASGSEQYRIFRFEHLFELDVAARDRVADDHQVEIGGDVLGVVADEAS